MRASGSRAAALAWAVVFVAGMHGLAFAEDCNHNGISDVCDVACWASGCDTATCGYSDDADLNGIPDECEGAPTSVTFTTTADFTAGPSLQGRVKSISLDPDAVDQLQRSEQPEPLPFLWVAATASGTVVKIDTTTGTIRGEYYSSPADWIGSPPESNYASRGPSRTAVNLDGEVWVGNRGEDAGSGSVVKIGLVIGGTEVNDVCVVDNRVILAPPFEYNTCMDRDGDGHITTSAGLLPLPWPNTDGADSAGGVSNAGVSTAVDECIIQYVRAGGEATRYVAVDNDNNVWVGSEHSYNKFELLDGFTGELLERFGAPSTFAVNCGGFGGIVDGNNVLWSANQFPHGERMFRYDTATDIADPACCDAKILADLNLDGVIDDADDGLQGTEYVIFPVNSDDDDGDGYPDYTDEGPAPYEDDLAEIELLTGCYVDDPQGWWMVHWVDPDPDEDPTTETIKIWADPQKSDGEGNAGLQVANGVHYAWPPQPSVWVEALEAYDEIVISFTINYDEGRAQETGTIKTSSPCFEQTRYAVIRAWSDSIPGITGFAGGSVWLTTSVPPPLCGEPDAALYAHSAAWVSVNIDPETPEATWAQMGYTRSRDESPNPYYRRYVETNVGPNFEDWDLVFLGNPGAGDHFYYLQLEPVTGTWTFYFQDPYEVVTIPDPWWINRYGNHIGWGAETLNHGDRLVGRTGDHVVFGGPAHVGNDFVWRNAHLLDEVTYPPRNDAPATFGLDVTSDFTFEVWDSRE